MKTMNEMMGYYLFMRYWSSGVGAVEALETITKMSLNNDEVKGAEVAFKVVERMAE